MARATELLVEEVGDELLVYDQRNDQVHCLGSAAGRVWRACDGKTSVEQLSSVLNIDSGLVEQALGELEGCGLLDGEPASGLTRREATARFAKVGAAAAAAPLIVSIAAPAPAMALTACGTGRKGCQGGSTDINTNVLCGGCSPNCACCVTSGNQCKNGTGPKTSYTACVSACTTAGGCTVANVYSLCSGLSPSPTTVCGTGVTGTHCFT